MPCLIRIDDIDKGRSRQAFEDSILDDLAWLGFESAGPIIHQMAHLEAYHHALEQLKQNGLVYPCFCSRRDVRERLKGASPNSTVPRPDELFDAPLRAPHGGSLAQVGASLLVTYDGHCRNLTKAVKERKLSEGEPHLYRLDAQAAITAIASKSLETVVSAATLNGTHPVIAFWDQILGHLEVPVNRLGDLALTRRDIATSYHLSVVVDDALQGITHVPRGDDLAPITFYHVLLQACLGLPTPIYHHHQLVLDDTGKRLAKRHDSAGIKKFREEGYHREDVLALARRGLGPA